MEEAVNRRPRDADIPGDELRRNYQPPRKVLIAVILLGLVARLAIAAVSIGTNDSGTWFTFGAEIHDLGLLKAYQTDPLLNHPPLAALWAEAAFDASKALSPYWLGAGKPPGVRGLDTTYLNPGTIDRAQLGAFAFVFKVPVVVADALACLLLWHIFSRRMPNSAGLRVCALFSWSLCSIFATGYHCNTDPIFAMLCLLCVDLMESSNAWFLSGLALGAAINIKILPVLLIAPLLLSCKTRRGGLLFIAGLSIAAIPFIPILLGVGPSFYRNALAYNSLRDRWGVGLLLWPQIHPTPLSTWPTSSLKFIYATYGRYVVFTSIIAWGFAARAWRRWNRYEIAAVTFAIFLVLTPGFGIQYLVMLVPLLFAASPKIATVYSTFAGLFSGIWYFHNWHDGLPAYSFFSAAFSKDCVLFGLAAWLTLIWFLATIIMKAGATNDRPAQWC